MWKDDNSQPNNHLPLFQMGNQPTSAQQHSNTASKDLFPEAGHPHHHPHGPQEQISLETMEQIPLVTVDYLTPPPLPAEEAYDHKHKPSPKKSQPMVLKPIHTPTAALPPIKKHRSLKMIEEIAPGKENAPLVEPQHACSTYIANHAPPPASQIQNRPQQDAHIEVSDLRESEGGVCGDVKEFRVKKMRLSKNSLHCPGAYF